MEDDFNYYGYGNYEANLVTIKTQVEHKEDVQDAKIQQNADDNVTQQQEIDRNTLINDAQIEQINDLYYKIDHIPSGTTDFDFGEW